MPLWLSALCLVLEKKYAIWHFGFSRSAGNKYASMHEAVNVMNILYFYEIFFSFYEKVPSPLDHVALFSKYFYLNLPWCFQLILISQEFAALLKESFENYQKNVCSGVYLQETPTVAGIQPTTYHRSKDCNTDTFWKSPDSKLCSKIL